MKQQIGLIGFIVIFIILSALGCAETSTVIDLDPSTDGDIDPDLDTNTPPEDGDVEEDGPGCLEDPVDGDPDDMDGDWTDTDQTDTQETGDPDTIDGDTSEDDGDVDEDDITEVDTDPEEIELDPTLTCPDDMVLVTNTTCMDKYEASRLDATTISSGMDDSIAKSVAGVLPWNRSPNGAPLEIATARAACAAADKRLCQPDEWQFACEGPSQLIYSYGDTYNPTTCNGIDTFCHCDDEECASLEVCPFAGCRNTCGASFHSVPTGSFPNCQSPVAELFDITGNVWELVDTTDGSLHYRGGAYNCNDSAALHQCAYDATWGPSAQGFRCCKTPESSTTR